MEPLTPARPYGATCGTRWDHFMPAPTRAHRSRGWTVISSSPLVETSRWPAREDTAPWPVAWTPVVRPWAPAKRTAWTTSCAVRAWTTAAGRIGTERFQGVTRASYSWSDGSYTAPSRRARSWSSGVRWTGRANVRSAVWVAVVTVGLQV